jgi:hypothetical protein
MITALIFASHIPLLMTAPDEVMDRVQALVSHELPAANRSHVDRITVSLVLYSRQHKIDPLIAAVTAYKESRFKMSSSPQLGIMQFTRSTWNQYSRRGLRATVLEHNVQAGVDYLAQKLYGTTKRNAQGTFVSKWGIDRPTPHFTRNQLLCAWTAYNTGSWHPRGPYNGYARACLRLYYTAHARTAEQIRAKGLR